MKNDVQTLKQHNLGFDKFSATKNSEQIISILITKTNKLFTLGLMIWLK